jgi:hypothetical protein
MDKALDLEALRDEMDRCLALLRSTNGAPERLALLERVRYCRDEAIKLDGAEFGTPERPRRIQQYREQAERFRNMARGEIFDTIRDHLSTLADLYDRLAAGHERSRPGD